jgi:nicotinamidase-related amidase
MPVLQAIEEFSTSCGQNAWDALPKIKELLEASRAAGIPVAFIKGNPMDKFFAGDTTKGVKSRAETAAKYDHPIHPMVAPGPDEYVVQKSKGSAFFGTVLSSFLVRNGIDSVLISGCVTSGCVRATTIDAWNHGFAPYVVEEAVFDRSRHSHLTSLFELNAKYSTVVTLEETKEYLAKLRK